MSSPRIVAVAGTMGAGKSSLVEWLRQQFGMVPFFEPNDESLWASLRLNVSAFMMLQFRAGAFQGATASDAFFVKIDASTTTQADIDAGVVNILVGFAPLKPAEFVVLMLTQKVNQAA